MPGCTPTPAAAGLMAKTRSSGGSPARTATGRPRNAACSRTRACTAKSGRCRQRVQRGRHLIRPLGYAAPAALGLGGPSWSVVGQGGWFPHLNPPHGCVDQTRYSIPANSTGLLRSARCHSLACWVQRSETATQHERRLMEVTGSNSARLCAACWRRCGTRWQAERGAPVGRNVCHIQHNGPEAATAQQQIDGTQGAVQARPVQPSHPGRKRRGEGVAPEHFLPQQRATAQSSPAPAADGESSPNSGE